MINNLTISRVIDLVHQAFACCSVYHYVVSVPDVFSYCAFGCLSQEDELPGPWNPCAKYMVNHVFDASPSSLAY